MIPNIANIEPVALYIFPIVFTLFTYFSVYLETLSISLFFDFVTAKLFVIASNFVLPF